ncbi:NACHT domain-containing protein [Nocardia sp. NBC_01327]|uniref:NACHT domain-containing protein n=1 Tax=Nocardia sp. NBC_01327 TaxID=2903593 RepID=UPI002E152776|nr:NACHT domain-containing protein [Nocardia sp. NBC_01327]
MAEQDSITEGLTAVFGGVAAGAIIVGIAAAALKKFGDKLGEGLYASLTTLLRRGYERIAIRFSEDRRITHYRAKIPDEYGRHVLTLQRQIAVESVYVHLQYERGGRRHDLRRQVLQEKAVLLLGEAGAGKSLLSKHFLLHWAAQPRKAKQRQKIPVLVELHRCDGSVDLPGLIAAHFRLPHDKNDSRAVEFVAQRLNEGSMRLLFDGLDEVSADEHAGVVAAIESFRRDHASGDKANSVVVTGRGSAYNGSLSAFEVIKIAGFDDSSILRFLGRWLVLERSAAGGLTAADIAELGTADRIFEQIRQNPQLLQLARTPLLLSLLADLYTGSLVHKGRSLPSSRADFYARVTDHMVMRDLLLDRGERASPYQPRDKLAVLKRIAVFMTETPADQGDRLILSQERLREVLTTTLAALDLRPEHGRELVRDLTDRSQMLVGSDTGERFWFPHRSFQEYFTARALEGPVGAARLLAGYWSDPAFWRDTVRFWCGDGNNSTIVVQRLFESNDLKHRVLALECLSEASEIDTLLADRIVTHFLTELPRTPEPATIGEAAGIVEALGSVASRDTDRGRRVRRHLEAQAEAGAERAMRALARSGRADAAQFLVNLAVRNDDALTKECAGSMGEVAVSALADAVAADRLWPVDTLGGIGTPSAAMELARMVWSDDVRATSSAWWLCALIREPNIEAALEDHTPLGSEATTYAGLDGAWDPFTPDPQGRFARLMRRVAHLTNTSSPPDFLIERLDPRIVVLLSSLTLLRRRPPGSEALTIAMSDQQLNQELFIRSDRLGYGPNSRRLLHTYLQRFSYTASEIAMLDTLPPPVQRALIRYMLVFQFTANDAARAELWSRATQDVEHSTAGLTLWWRGMAGVATLIFTGAGIYRAVATIAHTWAWGPIWLAWPMLIVFAVFAVSASIAWYLEEVVIVTADLETLWRSTAIVTGCAAAALAVPGMSTIADWIGWPAVAVGAVVVALILIQVDRVIRKRDQANTNHFRLILQELQAAEANRQQRA